MTSELHRITTRITEAQDNAFQEARRKAGHSQSEAQREGMRLYCERYGVEMPDDMQSWGGRRPYGD